MSDRKGTKESYARIDQIMLQKHTTAKSQTYHKTTYCSNMFYEPPFS